MTQMINGKEFVTADEVEIYIREANLGKLDAQRLRLDNQRQTFQARRAEQLAKHPGAQKFLGKPSSFIMNAMNSAGLPGAANFGQAAVRAPLTAARRDIGLRDAFELNRQEGSMILEARPVSAAAGSLAGFFTPGSGGKKIAEAGFKAFGGGKLASAAAAETNTGRMIIKQLGSAFTGGAGSITAVNVTQGVFGEKSASETVMETLGMVTSPTNIALSAGGGGLASLARSVPDQPLLKLIETGKRLLGPRFTPTPDMYRREEGAIASLLDSLSVTAMGRRAKAKYLRDAVYEPFKASVETLRRAITPRARGRASFRKREEATAGAARDIRALDDILEAKMTAAGRAGFGEAARRGDQVSRSQAAHLLRAMRELNKQARAAKNTRGPRGSKISGALYAKGERLGSLRRVIHDANLATKNGGEWNLTPQMLDNIRKRLSPIAKFKARPGDREFSDRDVNEAKTMYRLIREVEAQASPPVDRALAAIDELRSLRNTLKPLAGALETADDIQLVRSMFTAKDFSRRWPVVEGQLSQLQIQRIRGAYYADFVEEMALMRGVRDRGEFLFSANKMDDAFSSPSSPFRRTVFDAVLPGVRKEVHDLARISDLVMKTAGRAEGSQTAGRAANMALASGIAHQIGQIPTAFKDPVVASNMLRFTLGIAGTLVTAEQLLTGRLAKALNMAASGLPVQPGQVLPAAAQQSLSVLNEE